MAEKKTQLTPRDWAEIEELWTMGETTLDDLATRYKTSASHLSRTLADKGIKKGSKAAEAKVEIQERMHEEQITEAMENLRRITETKEEHYKYSKTLSTLLFRLVAKQLQNKAPISAIKDDVKTLRDALQALQIARHERWAVLGLDKDPDTGEESTTLIIQEMTHGDIEQVRQRYKGSVLADDVDAVEKEINMIEQSLTESADAVVDRSAKALTAPSDG